MADDLPFDTRPSVRITNTIMENPKISSLSDAAFRAYIEAICYCSRQETDGIVAAPSRLGKPRAIKELLSVGLLEVDGENYRVHDYLRHQRSQAEINAFRESKSDSGKLGAHKRWHIPRRQVVHDCPYCLKGVGSA